jgi:hypothetical protein
MRSITCALILATSALVVAACGARQSGPRRQESRIQANAERSSIIDRLIPEDGLHPSRRAWLIDAISSVMPGIDKDDLQNPTRLRATLQDTSLSNLRRIEAAYKQNAQNAGN